jgi:two-component system KDP operon response regulator KdpE
VTSEATPRVLVVEDDRVIRRVLRTALESDGWRVFEAETVAQGLAEAKSLRPDLLFVDLGLPDGDGVDLIVAVREWSRLPIIVVSARSQEEQKVRALDAGADDYVEKPFRIAELLARVRASMRRHGADAAASAAGVVSLGDVEIDRVARIVRKGGRQVHLTPIEFRLLGVLAANAGRVLTHRQLLREVWGPARVEHNHYLRVFMGALRHKLEDDPAQPRLLLTETGVGYRLAASP